jgi:hypothetical protein
MVKTNNKRKDRTDGGRKQRFNANGKQKRQKRTESIVFDPEARNEYLRGFSRRKQERRAYGLAMQKVKDRKAKLEHRAELKSAEMEQIEEAESRKQLMLEMQLQQSKDHDEKRKTRKKGVIQQDEEKESTEITTVQSYHDVKTQQQWGGEVIVTTSTNIPGDSDDEIEPVAARKSRDYRQEYAGNVERFLKSLKRNLPKKKNADHTKRRGKHGAVNMKGVGSESDLKTAQKVLARSKKAGKQGGKKQKR